MQHHSCRKMHWTTPWSRVLPKSLSLVPIQSQINPAHTLQLIYWRSILILSSHLYLGLMSALFQVSPPKPSRCLSCTPCMPHDPTHLHPSESDHLNAILVRTTDHKAPHYAISSNPLLSFPPTLFSDTLSLCSTRNVRDQVSCSYKTTGK